MTDDLRKLAEAALERQQPGTMYSPRLAGDAYIAAANPARVLALLDELEAARAEIASLEGALEIAKSFFMPYLDGDEDQL